MKKLWMFPVLIALVACLSGCVDDTQIVRHTNYVVVTPPSILYNCPKVVVPNTAKLSNKGIAQYVLAQYNANVVCRNNMAAIKSYVDKAKQIYLNQ